MGLPKHPFVMVLAAVASLGSVGANAFDLAETWKPLSVISGKIEVEALAWDGDSGSGSDVVLDKVELGFDAHLNQYVHGHLLLLYEEGGQSGFLTIDGKPVGGSGDVYVDEATITVANQAASPAFFRAGRMYVPFGRFETNMITDPLTQMVGEAREDALQLGWQQEEGIYGSVFVFNGDTQDGGKEAIEHWGASIGLVMGSKEQGLDMGISYLNSIADSDGLGLGLVDDYAGGVAVHAVGRLGPVRLIGEYVTALDDASGPGSQVRAYNLEAGYQFQMLNKPAIFALGYQRTEEGEDFDLPEERALASLSVELFDFTSVAVELARQKGYDGRENDVGTVQLATGF